MRASVAGYVKYHHRLSAPTLSTHTESQRPPASISDGTWELDGRAGTYTFLCRMNKTGDLGVRCTGGSSDSADPPHPHHPIPEAAKADVVGSEDCVGVHFRTPLLHKRKDAECGSAAARAREYAREIGAGQTRRVIRTGSAHIRVAPRMCGVPVEIVRVFGVLICRVWA